MSDKNIRVVEPIVMRLKHPNIVGILLNNLDKFEADFIKEAEEKGSIILEVYNESDINNYLLHWLELVAVIPGIEKTYPQDLNLLTDAITYEMAFIEIITNNSYNVLSLLPVDLKYDQEKGTTLYLCKLTKQH